MASKDDSPDGINLSRRNFLKSTGVVGIAATVVSPGEAQTGPPVVGPGEVPVRLNVNGRQPLVFKATREGEKGSKVVATCHELAGRGLPFSPAPVAFETSLHANWLEEVKAAHRSSSHSRVLFASQRLARTDLLEFWASGRLRIRRAAAARRSLARPVPA